MIVLDIGTGLFTFFLIYKDMENENNFWQLIKDFYSYPKIGAILSLFGLLSIQYSYTAIFFTQKL